MTTIRGSRTCTSGAGPDNWRCRRRLSGAGVPLPGALAADAEGLADDRPADAGGAQPGDLGGDVGVEALPATDQQHELGLALHLRAVGPCTASTTAAASRRRCLDRLPIRALWRLRRRDLAGCPHLTCEQKRHNCGVTTEPLRAVRDHLSELVDRVEREHERVVVTRNGRAAAVLISPEDLAELEETLAVLGDARALRHPRGRRSAREGDVLRGIGAVARCVAENVPTDSRSHPRHAAPWPASCRRQSRRPSSSS